MSHDMAHNVIPFPPEKSAPIVTRRWRTIVDVNGTRYALDVTASYSVLPSAAAAVEPLQKPAEAAAPEPAVEPPPLPPRKRRSLRGERLFNLPIKLKP
jgi:hypothetical protein